jgi:hypothetical protein
VTGTTHTTTASTNDILTQIKELGDQGVINDALTKIGNKLIEYVQSYDTPLQVLLKEKYIDNINFRRFMSIDINQSPDGIYYKNVVTNPNDTVDKMHLFNYGKSVAGEEIFPEESFTPIFNNNKISYDEMVAALTYKVPASQPQWNNPTTQLSINKFKVLSRGSISSSD